MLRSIFTSVSSMIALENKQNTITNNMSNSNTTGYKSEDLLTKSFKEVMIQNRDKVQGKRNVTQKLGTLSLGTKIDTVYNKFTQGTMQQTNRTWDFGVNGRGFIAIQAGNQEVYTRDGNFAVANDGYLVTTTGDRVLGINNVTGAKEPIFVGNSEFTLDADKNIVVNGQATSKLLTADFEDYQSLQKMGDNYYIGQNPIYNAQVDVRQGYLEASNVNVTDEMVDMISVMRNFETNQKVLTMLDETLNKTANEVGTVR